MNALMANKAVVITGATSGIGQAAAETLAAMGARIIQVARDRTRGEAAMKRLCDLAPHTLHAIFYADLSKIGEIKQVASEISGNEPRVDVLVNNAGAIYRTRQVTEDGLERTFVSRKFAGDCTVRRTWLQSVCHIETMQCAVYARAGEAHAGNRRDCKLLSSRFCGYPLRG